jgi:hypothetical protein
MAYSPIEDKYLSALTAMQFPDEPPMPEESMPGRQPGDVMLAAGPSGTVSDASQGVGEIKAIPRNAVVGGIASFVRDVRDMANQYEIKDWVPLLGKMGVGDLLLGKSPEEIENWAYGNSPFAMPPSGTGGFVPIVKTGRKEGLADVLSLGIDAAPIGKALSVGGKVGIKAGKAMLPEAGKMIINSMDKLGTPVQMNLIENAPSMGGAATREITRQEKSAITSAAKRNPALKESATTAVDDFHNNYSVDAGWAPAEVNKITFKTSKTGEKIPEIETNAIPYDFHTPPEGVPKEAWQATLSSRIVDEVQSVVDRAKSGDQAALDIIAEAGWYRTMRDRLRSEFGGIGDVFADVLGTTSAQTDVRQNFKNAVAILNKFSRGDYDNALAAYESRVNTGKSIDPGTLNKLYQSGDFDLIKSDAGALFNTNSPASMGALLDMFRAVKAGDSPKTPNFTGNLIGLTNEATIDVWAARLLRRMADLPRIPPPAEKGVAGKHLKGSTLYNPNVGSEFGFGQNVFKEAAAEINSSGIVKGVDPQIGDLGPDDLQAVVWFIEKENWAKNGWTTKAGEGGSLDYEMSLAGSPEQAKIGELRKGINAGFQPPPMRVGEKREMRDTLPTDPNVVGPPLPPFVGPSTYPGRADQAKQVDIANKIAMRQELETLNAPLERYQLGVSGERPNKPMSNYGQAELASEFDDVVRNDPSVPAYNLSNTYGSFMGQTERALNAEFVTRQNFDPAPLERRLVEQGKAYDQDAVFMSKVVKDGTQPNARPGVEIYFKQKITPDQMAKVTERLRQYGVDGFTYVTDMRFSDKVNVQVKAGAAETAGLNGIRFQYIPEFDDAYNATNRTKIMAEKQRLFNKIVSDTIQDGNVSDARVVYYDTKVHFRSDYDAYLGRNAEGRNPTSGAGSSSGANATQSSTSGEVGKDFTRAVSDRLRKKATSSKSSTVKRGGAAPTSGAE